MSGSVDSPCREWQGARNEHNYGTIYRQAKKWKVHRWVWQLVTGEILTPDEFILHHCDNPPCFRFDHLFKGDQKANLRDMNRKKRGKNSRKTHCSEGHPLIWRSDGGRRCPICTAKYQREYYRKNRT